MTTALVLIISGLITFITGGDFFQIGTKKLTRKGWVVSLLIVAGILVGIFDAKKSNKEMDDLVTENQKGQLKADTLQSKLTFFQEHFDLKTEVTYSQNELLQLTADSLRLRLESLTSNNQIEKMERELEAIRLKKRLEQLDNQLKLAHKSIKENVESSSPQVDICKPIKWGVNSKDTSKYQIYIPICNTGKRTAQNIRMNSLLLAVDMQTNLVERIPFDVDINESTALSPFSETGYMFYPKILNLPLDTLKIAEQKIIIHLEFLCTDSTTNKQLRTERCYSWNGYKENYLNFNTSGQSDLDLIKPYLLPK